MHEPVRVNVRARRLADHAIVCIDDIEYLVVSCDHESGGSLRSSRRDRGPVRIGRYSPQLGGVEIVDVDGPPDGFLQHP